MLEIKAIAGMMSGLIALVAFIPYIDAILRGKTKPNRATWLIWTIVSTISLFSYGASGAGNTIWYPVSDAVAPLIVLILAVKWGEGGWTYLDRACLIMAGLALFLWWLFGIALIGLCMSLIADATGAIPTILKAYYRPEGEDRTSWTITFSAVMINVFAIESWSFSISIYPLYMLLSTVIITGLIWVRRGKIWQ